jgi:HSP20 family protein
MVNASVGEVFRHLGLLVERLANMAEEAESFESAETAADRPVQAVCGFSVRVARDGKPRLERFGNVRAAASGPVIDESREPIVDVFDEGDHLRVVAELPGVERDDVRVELRELDLELQAAHGDRRYTKKLRLPAAVRAQEATSSYRNGIFELKVPKAPAR